MPGPSTCSPVSTTTVHAVDAALDRSDDVGVPEQVLDGALALVGFLDHAVDAHGFSELY
jgi:hypothetical protein